MLNLYLNLIKKIKKLRLANLVPKLICLKGFALKFKKKI